MKRFFNLLILSSIAIILLFFIFSMIDTAHSIPYISEVQAACDLTELSRIEAEFQNMVQLRKQDPAAIADEVYKAAALAYIENAEFCYETTVAPSLQAQTEPVLIDEGGKWFPGFEPDEDELSGQYVPQGNKWGVPGFGNPGGTVTYSYIPQGVSHAVEGEGGNTHISNLNGFSSCFYTEVETAFAAWSAVGNIGFVQVADNGYASNAPGAVGDIRIGAHYFDGPYDGNPTVLAHAYFPPPNGTSIAGDLHFDSAENWHCTPSGGFDIGFVTLHEIGHSLGLLHEQTNLAVMNPYYDPGISNLLADDINGIIAIYGIKPPTANQSTDPFPILVSTETITYTLFIRNSSVTLTNVLITNTIPGSTTYEFGSASNGGSETFPGSKILTWPPTTIPGSSTISRTFKVMVTETITDGDTLINTLSATSDEAANIENQLLVSFVNPKLIYFPLIFR